MMQGQQCFASSVSYYRQDLLCKNQKFWLLYYENNRKARIEIELWLFCLAILLFKKYFLTIFDVRASICISNMLPERYFQKISVIGNLPCIFLKVVLSAQESNHACIFEQEINDVEKFQRCV